MSLYKNYEQLYSVYHAVDDLEKKTTTYSSTPAFTIMINAIRRNEDTLAVIGEDMGEYVANVNAKYPNAENIKMGDKLVNSTYSYIVVNKPKYVRLFNKYKLILNSNRGKR